MSYKNDINYPYIYPHFTTNFIGMGSAILGDCISCVVTEERNGQYILELEYPRHSEHAKLLERESIIVCDTSYTQKAQKFIIKSVNTTDDVIEVYAEHYFYKTMDNQILPQKGIEGRSALYALQAWKSWLIADNDFRVESDVGHAGTTYWDVDDFDNAKEVLAGREGSILDTWGGEYQFDNNSIYLWRQRGVNRYTPIAYGRNLKHLEKEESIEEVYTSIYPYAKYQNKDKEGNAIEGSYHVLTLPEKYLDYTGTVQIENKVIKKVDFSQHVVSKDGEGNPLELTELQLRQLANTHMRNNRFGIPKINFEIPFKDISKYLISDGAGDVENHEKYELCDIVPIWLPREDIQLSAKIIKVEWNVLKGTYDTITLGDPKDDLRVIFDKASYNEINQAIKTVSQDINNRIVVWYNDTVGYVDDKTSSLSGNIEDSNNKINELSNQVSNNNTKVDSLSTEVGSTKTDIANLKNKDVELNNSITGMKTLVDGSFTRASTSGDYLILYRNNNTNQMIQLPSGASVDTSKFLRKDDSLSSANFNTIYDIGLYSIRNGSNMPTGAGSYGALLVMRADGTTSSTTQSDSIQMYIDNNAKVFTRSSVDKSAGVWTDWTPVGSELTYNGVLFNAHRTNNTVTLTTVAGADVKAIYDEKLPVEFRPDKVRRASASYHNSSSAVTLWNFRITTTGWVYCDFTTIGDNGSINTNRTTGTLVNSVSVTYTI